MANPLIQAGALAPQSKYAPIHTDTFFTGLWTQRNPLRDAAVPYLFRKFYAASRFESLIDGLNVEVTSRLTLARRRGFSIYNSATWGHIQGFYSFRFIDPVSGLDAIKVIVDADSNLYDGTGPSTQTLIFAKTQRTRASLQSVGRVLYMGLGSGPTNIGLTPKKYRYDAGAAAWVTEDWGARNVPAAPVINGPFLVNADFELGNTLWLLQGGWTILSDGQAQAGSFAAKMVSSVPTALHNGALIAVRPNDSVSAQCQCKRTAGDGMFHVRISWRDASDTEILVSTGTSVVTGIYNLSTVQAFAPANAVYARIGADCTGMTVSTTGYVDTFAAFVVPGASFWQPSTSFPGATAVLDTSGNIQLYINGTTGTVYPSWNATQGGVTTDGGAAWFNAGKPVAWKAGATIAYPTALVDSNGNLQVSSSSGTSGGGAPAWSAGVGQNTIDNTVTWVCMGPYTVRARFRQQWCLAYHTKSGDVSTASGSADSQGPVMGLVWLGYQVVSDPQIDAAYFFRTVDNGSTFLFADQAVIAATGNFAWVDSKTDAQLNTQLQAPINNNNDAPPTGLTNLCYHDARIFGSLGNVLYWTRLADATPGVTFECMPPVNQMALPGTILKTWPTAIGLIVFTTAGAYLILGNGSLASPYFAKNFMKQHRLGSQIAFAENGATAYLMTADKRVLALDPGAGIVEVGFPVGDIFNGTAGLMGGIFQSSFDLAYTTLAYHLDGSAEQALYVNDGRRNYLRMNPVAAPETGLVWSPLGRISEPFGKIGATMQSVETAPAVNDLLVGPTYDFDGGGPPASLTGPILRRDATANKDTGFGGSSAAFSAYATLGSIVLAHHGQVAEIGFIGLDSIKVGTRPVVGLLLGEIAGGFDSLYWSRQDPPLLPASASLYGDRYYAQQNQQPTYGRHLQIKFTWAAEDFHNELLAFAIFGAVRAEKS